MPQPLPGCAPPLELQLRGRDGALHRFFLTARPGASAWTWDRNGASLLRVGRIGDGGPVFSEYASLDGRTLLREVLYGGGVPVDGLVKLERLLREQKVAAEDLLGPEA